MRSSSAWFSDAPLVIAHRGASLVAPENTLAAFRLAVELGADAIELDAKLTRDGHVVVHHDQTLERTTDGRGRLSDRSLDEIKQLDAGSYFKPSYTGERIPTLEEVFAEFGGRILINVELTNYASPVDDLPEIVVNLIQKHRLEDRVLLSSFNPLALRKSKRLAPSLPLALLTMPKEPRWVRLMKDWMTDCIFIHPHKDLIKGNIISSMQIKERKVNVWTVNEPALILSLVEQGVDGVITDDPALACRCVGRSA
jgi:glycerophosphoryl diester phosphodiesterase